MSKIVTEVRMVAEDLAVDGFGHHNPQLGQEDDLFYNTLSINQFMEGFFCGRDLSTNEAQFFRLMRMGILDGREGYDMPMTASTRLMRHTAAVLARLFVMFEHEQQRVHSLGMSDQASLTRARLGRSPQMTGQRGSYLDEPAVGLAQQAHQERSEKR